MLLRFVELVLVVEFVVEQFGKSGLLSRTDCSEHYLRDYHRGCDRTQWLQRHLPDGL